LPALSSLGETIGTGQACSLRVARLFGRGFNSPRLQNFAKRNFVLSEPMFRGESKGKVAMFHAYILRCGLFGRSRSPIDRTQSRQRLRVDSCAAPRRAGLDRTAFDFVFGSQARESNKTMESRKEGRFGWRFPSTPLRTGLTARNSPRLQNFAKRNFVLSEPVFRASRRAKWPCSTLTS